MFMPALENHSDKVACFSDTFLDLADLLTEIKDGHIMPFDDDYQAILDANRYMWYFVKNYIPGNMGYLFSGKSKQELEILADYVDRACNAIADEGEDEELLGRLITFNQEFAQDMLSQRSH